MKGQVKMFETIAVLIVFFFLLFTGAAFYFGAQKSSLQKERVKASEQYAFQTALKAFYLPELDCSFLVTQKDNCIDKIKMTKLAELINTNEKAQTDYYSEFGYSTITTKDVFTEEKWTIYTNIPEDYTSKIKAQTPILLYDAWVDRYSFGVIEVDVYV
ncbi:hypothetical protein KY319_02835 [Candidatus Woesearchaeota archaeon]|nr:hypothetical protein [Candidatus Woesearchaeota archaeon]